MHRPSQRFRLGTGGSRKAIRVRRNAQDEYFSRMNDIQRFFPDATRFRVNNTTVAFLEDMDGKVYLPKRIAHYPHSILEVVTDAQEQASQWSPVWPFDKSELPAPLFPPSKAAVRSPQLPKFKLPTRVLHHLGTVGPSNVSTSTITDLEVPSVPANTNTNSTKDTRKNSKAKVGARVKEKYYLPDWQSMRQVICSKGDSDFAWDSALKKATITLTMDLGADNFFERLFSKASDVEELDMTFNWAYKDADLSKFSDQIVKSNVRFLRLDLNDGSHSQMSEEEVFQVGNGKYQSLLSLFSEVNKLQEISLVNLSHFGSRTTGLFDFRNPSSLVISHRSSNLQSFHFTSAIRETDDALLESILFFCPRLADVRLGSFSWTSDHSPRLEEAIRTLRELKSLHLYNLISSPLACGGTVTRLNTTPNDMRALKSVFRIGLDFGYNTLQETIHRSLPTIEVLVLRSQPNVDTDIDLSLGQHATPTVLSSPTYSSMSPIPRSNDLSFSRLTHLDLAVKISQNTHAQLEKILPGLDLVHFGAERHTKELIKSVKFSSLKSIWLFDMEEEYLHPLFDAFLGNTKDCQLEAMRVGKITNMQELPDFLEAVSLQRLYVSVMGHEDLTEILKAVDLTRLQVLTIMEDEYNWLTEETLAKRQKGFPTDLKVQLGFIECNGIVSKRDVYDVKARHATPSDKKLARGRVHLISSHCLYEEFMQSILPGRSLWVGHD
ncbi:hypothetical protein EC991_006933 [Linnemannia zychae]|nr:hypothetical protein EC991_006933 [Linnemannia zychae]